MNKAKILTNVSIIVGFLGVLALIGAWVASATQTVFGQSEAHLFNDAIALLLVAIWLKLGAIYHK